MTNTPSIPGLVKSAQDFHLVLNLEAGRTHQNVQVLVKGLNKSCLHIEKHLDKFGVRPGNLPSRSMNAAIWFLFLRQSDHLEQHLGLVTDLQSRFVREMGLHHNPPMVDCFPSSYLFKLIPRPHTFTLMLHEGFLTAPDTIRGKLVQLAVKSKTKKRLFSEIKAYTKTEPYRQIVQSLNNFAKAVYYEPDAVGNHHHLKDSFQRVNWAYFEGKQTLPHLQWSKRTSHRKLGHFNPVPDTIQISSALDTTKVPEYVLDYVMYHEMVHRILGISEINGRKSSHNAAFHQMEREYAHYEKAKQFFSTKKYINQKER